MLSCTFKAAKISNMLSANQIKYFKSLHLKKNRDTEGLFIAEGDKLLGDLLASEFECVSLFQIDICLDNAEKVSSKEMSRLSALKNHSNSFGVFKKKSWNLDLSANKVICLDGVQDPGNFGTILRLMDWFGITQVICSKDTVDVYNPKVVQATMGSLRNITVSYGDLESILTNEYKSYTKLGAFMEGEDVKVFPAPKKFVLVMGSEGKGVRENIRNLIDSKISIPKDPSSQAESLNVAVSCGLIMHRLL
jgi:TrmH family RNA methyltransferase